MAEEERTEGLNIGKIRQHGGKIKERGEKLGVKVGKGIDFGIAENEGERDFLADGQRRER